MNKCPVIDIPPRKNYFQKSLCIIYVYKMSQFSIFVNVKHLCILNKMFEKNLIYNIFYKLKNFSLMDPIL